MKTKTKTKERIESNMNHSRGARQGKREWWWDGEGKPIQKGNQRNIVKAS